MVARVSVVRGSAIHRMYMLMHAQTHSLTHILTHTILTHIHTHTQGSLPHRRMFELVREHHRNHLRLDCFHAAVNEEGRIAHHRKNVFCHHAYHHYSA